MYCYYFTSISYINQIVFLIVSSQYINTLLFVGELFSLWWILGYFIIFRVPAFWNPFALNLFVFEFKYNVSFHNVIEESLSIFSSNISTSPFSLVSPCINFYWILLNCSFVLVSYSSSCLLFCWFFVFCDVMEMAYSSCLESIVKYSNFWTSF